MDDSDDLSARLFPMATYFMCIDNGSTTVFSAFTMASGGKLQCHTGRHGTSRPDDRQCTAIDLTDVLYPATWPERLTYSNYGQRRLALCGRQRRKVNCICVSEKTASVLSTVHQLRQIPEGERFCRFCSASYVTVEKRFTNEDGAPRYSVL